MNSSSSLRRGGRGGRTLGSRLQLLGSIRLQVFLLLRRTRPLRLSSLSHHAHDCRPKMQIVHPRWRIMHTLEGTCCSYVATKFHILLLGASETSGVGKTLCNPATVAQSTPLFLAVHFRSPVFCIARQVTSLMSRLIC